MGEAMMAGEPVRMEIGAVFVPVSDIEAASQWYARLFGLAAAPATQHGHLAVFAQAGDGADLVLDSRIFAVDERRSGPLFHLRVEDIEAGFAHVEGLGAAIVQPIQSNHWFTFRDPDGNTLMVCAATA